MKEQSLMGVFPYFDDLLNAVKALKKKNLKINRIYSPTRRHEIDEVLGTKRSPVRYFTLVGGILGISTGIGLSVFTAAQWRFIVGGKPPIPAVPYVIEAFEFCILLSVFLNLLGLALLTRLPKFSISPEYDPRFSEDRFGILVSCPETEREEVVRMLIDSGAEEVNDVK